MYLIEYMINGELELDDILEKQFDQLDDSDTGDPELTTVPIGTIEFENLKKYLLYDKLKEVKIKLEKFQLDRKDPEVVTILQFVELVSLFFNSFSYREVSELFDTLVTAISDKLKIKLPTREFEEPPIKQDDVKQAPLAEQPQVQQQQPMQQPMQQQIPTQQPMQQPM